MELALVRESFDEILVVSDTAASDEVKQLAVSVTRVNEFDKVLFLTPCYSSDCVELSEKRVATVDVLQQLIVVDCQGALASFVQRTNVTELRSNICTGTFYAR